MSKRYSRDILFNVNEPQQRILYPFYVACFIVLGCLVFFAYLFVKHPLLQNAETYHTLIYNYDLSISLKAIILGLITTISIVLLIVVYWAYLISNRILGPYDRILQELDNVLAGKRREPLKIRKNDEMFDELLKRINVLIQAKK